MDTNNPYSAPQTSLIEHEQQVYPVATSGWRFLNFLIDNVGQVAFAFLVGFSIYFSGLGSWYEALSPGQHFLLDIGIFIVYFATQEALWGRTLGKLITRTRVVTEHDQPITWKHAMLRSLVRLVPFEAFSFLSSSQPRGWHDRWTGTKVVSLRAADIEKARAAQESDQQSG